MDLAVSELHIFQVKFFFACPLLPSDCARPVVNHPRVIGLRAATSDFVGLSAPRLSGRWASIGTLHWIWLF